MIITPIKGTHPHTTTSDNYASKTYTHTQTANGNYASKKAYVTTNDNYASKRYTQLQMKNYAGKWHTQTTNDNYASKKVHIQLQMMCQ